MKDKRLDFAYARGARCQWRFKDRHPADDGNWFTGAPPRVVRKGSWAEVKEFRLHPDDEHLQYGPISSALRHEALTTCQSPTGPQSLGMHVYPIVTYDEFYGAGSDVNSMHKLFMAELLADEGL
jgi:hypothetical protein